jgi:hypothetical protein
MKTMQRKLKVFWEADVGFAVSVAQAGSLPYRGLEIRNVPTATNDEAMARHASNDLSL